MQFECEDYGNEWVELEGVIDPTDVAIPIDSLVTEMGKAHLGGGRTTAAASSRCARSSQKAVRSDVSFLVPQGVAI